MCRCKIQPHERDPSTLTLEETLLLTGVEASLIGTWSASDGAIISKSEGVFLSLGPPENLSSKEGLPHSFGSYLISAISLTAIGAGIVWFALKILPTLK